MDGFQNIAVASTFSPRFLPLLSETKAFTQTLGRDFSVIHAGAPTADSAARFAEAFAELELKPEIFWNEAENPADAILQCLAEHPTDLLIAGALKKETAGRHFLGHVSRVLMRRAPCSLLFFTEPSATPQPFRNFAVVIDFSESSRACLQATVAFAKKTPGAKIHVLRIFTVFAQVLAEPQQFIQGGEPDSSALASETARLEQFIAEFATEGVAFDARCIEGTTGFAASDYVQSIEADLLVIPANPPTQAEVFPARLEWLFNVIPTNLLVYRPR